LKKLQVTNFSFFRAIFATRQRAFTARATSVIP